MRIIICAEKYCIDDEVKIRLMLKTLYKLNVIKNKLNYDYVNLQETMFQATDSINNQQKRQT